MSCYNLKKVKAAKGKLKIAGNPCVYKKLVNDIFCFSVKMGICRELWQFTISSANCKLTYEHTYIHIFTVAG